MPSADTKVKIAEQKGFLQRSVTDFMEGHPEEALRIATTIRLLVHETGRQKPLLKAFRSNYLDLPILDSIHEPPNGRVVVRIGIGVSFSDKGVQPQTDLEDTKLTTIGKWWRKSCLVFSPAAGQTIEFTRRDLLLTLADKEGGAHVDAVLPPEYERYVVNSPVKFMVQGVETDSIHLARFAAVQAAVQMIDCLNRLEHSVPAA